MMKNRIVKALVIFFLYLSIYTYMCIGGSGWFSRSPRRRRSYRCPMAIAAAGAASVACNQRGLPLRETS